MSAEPAQPSARAVERLATGVGEDVADLRTQLHQALTRADRLEAAGRQDLAVVVLQEQRDALVDVHRRLEARLADAAVEREAERVVGAASVGDGMTASRGGAPGYSDDGMVLRLVVSAAAAVLGVTLMLSPGAGTVGVTAAGSDATGDAAAVDGHRQGGDPVADAETATDPDAARGPDESAPPAALAGRASDSVRPADPWSLSIPEAYVLAPAPDEEADDEDGTDTGLGGVTEPLPPPDPALEPLTPEEPVLPVSEGDGDRDSGDGGEAADGGESELLGR